MLEITAEYDRFFLNGHPFSPYFEPRDVVTLSAHLDDDLHWEGVEGEAELIVAQKRWILWKIDLGLSHSNIFLDDPAPFHSFVLALEQFKKQLWERFKDSSFAVVLYEGAWPFSDLRLRQPEDSELDLLHRVEGLSEYLHRLGSFLPDTIPVFAQVDLSSAPSQALAAQLLSKERFEHVQLIVQGSKVPLSGLVYEEGVIKERWCPEKRPSLGVLFPSDAQCSLEVLAQYDALFAELDQKKEPYRLILESRLNEMWDGLDSLLLFSSHLTPRGRRGIQGFEAAGGRCVCM